MGKGTQILKTSARTASGNVFIGIINCIAIQTDTALATFTCRQYTSDEQAVHWKAFLENWLAFHLGSVALINIYSVSLYAPWFLCSQRTTSPAASTLKF